MQLNALFCCLWRNVEASCHKPFVVFSGNQHRCLLPVTSVTTYGTVVRRRHIDNICPVAVFTPGSEARYRLRIAISAYRTCIQCPHYGGSRGNITMLFCMEKLEWCGYPMVKKFWIYVNLFWHTGNVRTWRTHRNTLRDGIGCACKASRGKKYNHYHAMLCKRVLCCHAVSVHPSVTFVDHVKTNKHIFEIFFTFG